MPDAIAQSPSMREGGCPFCERTVVSYQDPARCPLCDCPLDEGSLHPFVVGNDGLPPG